MRFLSNLLTGGASNLIDSVGKVVDNLVTSKGEKMQLDNEMRKAEQAYTLDMAKLGLAEKKAELEDVSNARTTAATIQTSTNATNLSKNTGPYLALGTVGLTFILFFAVLFLNKQLVASNTKDVVIYILGALSSIIAQVFSFYFGSSQGSHDKQGMLNALSSNR